MALAEGWFYNTTIYHVTTTVGTLVLDGKPAVATSLSSALRTTTCQR